MSLKVLSLAILISLLHHDLSLSMEMEPPAKKQKIAEEQETITEESDVEQPNGNLLLLKELNFGTLKLVLPFDQLADINDLETETNLRSVIFSLNTIEHEINDLVKNMHTLNPQKIDSESAFIRTKINETREIYDNIEFNTDQEKAIVDVIADAFADSKDFISAIRCYHTLLQFFQNK